MFCFTNSNDIFYINKSKIGLEIYSEKLIKEGIVSPEDVKSVRDKYEKICEEAMELAKKETHIKVSMMPLLY